MNDDRNSSSLENRNAKNASGEDIAPNNTIIIMIPDMIFDVINYITSLLIIIYNYRIVK